MASRSWDILAACLISIGDEMKRLVLSLVLSMATTSIQANENIVASVTEMAKQLKLNRGTGINFSATGTFAVRVFGDGALCTAVHSSGYCEPSSGSINFSFGLLPRSQEALLYDLQGKRGCLTAHMDSYGTVYAVGIHAGACR